ncbi:MAG: hypothetical protein R2910_05545 [Gemmatimonadales bacterium]
MRAPTLTRTRLAIFAAFCVATGCGESSPSPTGINSNSAPPPTVVGPYHATKLTVKEAGTTTDLIAGGAQISLILTDSGTTTGSIVIPAAYSESGVEETLALDGSYTYDAETGTITFDQVADTFIRDMAWNAGGTELYGILDAGSYTLDATLKLGN